MPAGYLVVCLGLYDKSIYINNPSNKFPLYIQEYPLYTYSYHLIHSMNRAINDQLRSINILINIICR